MYITCRTLQQIRSNFIATNIYQRILNKFPGDMCLSFAYGSGVFPQANNSLPHSNMLDLIFVVRDPLTWHKENLKLNHSHYSYAMQKSGYKYISHMMQNYGAGVYFNIGATVEDRIIKYGTISEKNILEDLTKWKNLYISGRMHKPVHIFQSDFENSPALLEGLKSNLISALITSLLILPEQFTELELYHTLAGLSYSGDFRMAIGEDINKVSNIVNSNFERFQELYHPVLNGICEISNMQKPPYRSFIYWKKENATIEQDKSPLILHSHLQKLPITVQLQLCKVFDVRSRHIRDVEEILKSVARYPDIADVVQQSVRNIVHTSSKNQSLKGIVTAGPWTSIKYGGNKVKKMFKSLFMHRK